ncbi:MAG: polysaccharide deacetylase family protein [Alphaproteobacteria bacterium]
MRPTAGKVAPNSLRLLGITFILAVAELLLTLPARAADWAVILMYHRFGVSATPSTSVTLEQFEAHLEHLKTGGFTVLPVPDIVARLRTGRPLPDMTVGLTIDDAHVSVHQEAWPRLKAGGFPFTLFVNTAAVDRGFGNTMTWDQIRELAASGVTIGSHGAAHAHMPFEDRETNLQDLLKSRRRIEEEVGSPPDLFAYPYGEYSLEVRELVAGAGSAAAFGQHSGVAYSGGDLFALPRFALNETYGSLGRFRLVTRALPLRVTDVTPADPVLTMNPPAFGFTLADEEGNLDTLACYASGQGAGVIERLGERRVQVRLKAPFPPGRARINCTMAGPEGRWRWLGTQFLVPGS